MSAVPRGSRSGASPGPRHLATRRSPRTSPMWEASWRASPRRIRFSGSVGAHCSSASSPSAWSSPGSRRTRAAGSDPGLALAAEFGEVPASLAPDDQVHRWQPQDEPSRPERLPRPAEERERILVVDDPPVGEAELRMDVVDDMPPAPKGVGGDPVRGPLIAMSLVLRQLDLQVRGAPGQHPPHVPGLGPGQLAEGRVAEAAVRVIQLRHGVTVMAVHRAVELLDQLRV